LVAQIDAALTSSAKLLDITDAGKAPLLLEAFFAFRIRVPRIAIRMIGDAPIAIQSGVAL
jgi:hypothetical protein